MSQFVSEWDDYGPGARRHTVRGPSADLNVVDWGGEGPSVLLVHGVFCSAANWVPVVDRLRRSGLPLRLLALDLRGHGDSDKPTKGYDLAALTADFEAVVAKFELGRTTLVIQCAPWPPALELLDRNKVQVGGVFVIDPTIHRSSYPQETVFLPNPALTPVHELQGPFASPEAVVEKLCAASQEPDRVREDDEYIKYAILCNYRQVSETSWRSKWEVRKIMEMGGHLMAGAKALLPRLGDPRVPVRIVLATDVLWGARSEDTAALLNSLGVEVRTCLGPHNLVNYRPDLIADEICSFMKERILGKAAII